MERAGAETVIRNNTVTEAPRNSSPLQEDSHPKIETPPGQDSRRARSYETTKLWTGIAQTILFFAFVALIVATGVTVTAEQWVRTVFSNDYLVLLGFALLVGASEGILTFPLNWYAGYYLEHRYQLSNQTMRAWLWEGLKGRLVGLVIGVPLLLGFFFALRSYGELWWVPVGILLFVVSVVLARLGPVLIFPLFYTFRPLPEGEVQEKIMALCRTAGVAVSGIFTFDMSKNTKKANAAFTGIGKSKRIILGDTLLEQFTEDEIEAVFAHELGHYTMNHVWIMMGVGTASTFLGLFLTSLAYEASIGWFGFGGIDTIAALPLLGLWLGVYSLVTSPLNNMLSRFHEFAADRYAVRTTGNGNALADALKKLAQMNLADLAPNPVVEFLFHSHPSIERRLKAIGAR